MIPSVILQLRLLTSGSEILSSTNLGYRSEVDKVPEMLEFAFSGSLVALCVAQLRHQAARFQSQGLIIRLLLIRKCSEMFRNVQKCSEMFRNVQKLSRSKVNRKSWDLILDCKPDRRMPRMLSAESLSEG